MTIYNLNNTSNKICKLFQMNNKCQKSIYRRAFTKFVLNGTMFSTIKKITSFITHWLDKIYCLQMILIFSYKFISLI